MNLSQFTDIMSSPGQLGADSLGQLEKIVGSFPYFQTARTLYLLNLNQQKHIDFGRQLKLTAAYAADRSHLRKQILRQKTYGEQAFVEEEPGHQVVTEAGRVEQDTAMDPQYQQIKVMLKELEEKIRADMDEIEKKKSHLDKLLKEKRQLIEETEYLPLGEKDPGDSQQKPLPTDRFLDEFLQESIKDRPVTAFFDPVESARQSIIEDEDLVSETLARIVASQGNIPKAIKIYKRLALKYPKKSSYFAAQINKLEESK